MRNQPSPSNCRSLLAVVCSAWIGWAGLFGTIVWGQDSKTLAFQTAMAGHVRDVAQSILDSVVTIEVVGVSPTSGEVRQDAPTAGVIVDADGLVLTSAQVTRGESASILVVLPDGSRVAANVLGRDEHRELVLLELALADDAPPLKSIDLSSTQSTAASLTVGQTLVAVARYGSGGSPMVSSGILSAVERLEGIAIQTDARISPAFYGGPLLNLNGDVAGILIPATGGAGGQDPSAWYDSGVAFAVPSDVISDKLIRMRRGESIRAGRLGFVVGGKDPYAPGTKLAAVRVRSPAEAAGLQVGDEIIQVGGRAVTRRQEIKLALGPFDAGDAVDIEFRRKDQTQTVVVKLVESIPPLQPVLLGLIASNDAASDDSAAVSPPENGQQADDPPDSGGIVLGGTLDDSPAAEALRTGDRVLRLDGAEIADEESLRQQLWTADPDAPMEIQFVRGDEPMTIELSPQRIEGEWRTKQMTSVELELSTSIPSDASWDIAALRLPEVVNAAALLSPITDDESGVDPRRRGLLVWLLPPSEREPEQALQQWREPAKKAGVPVLMIASANEGRWRPLESEAVTSLSTAARRRCEADSAAIVIAGPAVLADGDQPGPADSMAIAVALSTGKAFSGLAVASPTRPPAVRLPSDGGLRMLRVLFPIGNADQLPPWSSRLTELGFPIQTHAPVDQRTLLNWVQSLLVL
ncbi:MAG: PDZ domain-containing protein [Planctomycetota bacterium]